MGNDLRNGHDLVETALKSALRSYVAVKSDEVVQAALVAVGARGISYLQELIQKMPNMSPVDKMHSVPHLIVHGVHPFDARQNGIVISESRPHILHHHLHYVCMFQLIGNERAEAAAMHTDYLVQREIILNADNKVKDWYERWKNIWSSPKVPPMLPRDLAVVPIPFNDYVDLQTFVGWYTEDSIQSSLRTDAASPHAVPLAIDLMNKFGADESFIDAIRLKALGDLYEILKRKSRQKSSMSEAVLLYRALDHDRARDVANDDTFKGQYVALLCTRETCTEAEMVMSLRLMTTSEPTRAALLKYLGRAPSFDEIKSVKGSGVVDILYEMPWNLLQPLLEKHENEVRGLLLRHVSMTERMTNCLSNNHTRAVAPEPWSAEQAVASWYKTFRPIYRSYRRHKDLRTQLALTNTSEAVRIAAVLTRLVTSGPDDLESLIRQVPGGNDVMRHVSDYKPLVVVRRYLDRHKTLDADCYVYEPTDTLLMSAAEYKLKHNIT